MTELLAQIAISAKSSPSGFRGEDAPQYADYARCVHCGLCLNSCPTYRLWGREADSPRGRIRQISLVDEGRLPLGESFVRHIDRCLDCRACETACPSGVQYGKLVEAARAQIEMHYRRPFWTRLARNLFYRGILPYPRRLAALARVARFYQRSGLQQLARCTGLLDLAGLAGRDLLMPKIEDEFFFSALGRTFPAAGRQRARVAFFAGCIAQAVFSGLNRATIRVLTANGCEVVVPQGQVCCGALALHAGMRGVARKLARENLAVFVTGDFDAIVTNAAGCGAAMKEYPALFPTEACAAKLAQAFSEKTRDVTEWLFQIGLVAPLAETKLRVTFQDSCHLAHGQRIRQAPRELIGCVPGVELAEMPLADSCCGSAGVYNVTHTQTSLELLAEKMRGASDTHAEAIVTANPGCLIQLRAGARIHKTGQDVLHVIELLDRAQTAAAISRR